MFNDTSKYIFQDNEECLLNFSKTEQKTNKSPINLVFKNPNSDIKSIDPQTNFIASLQNNQQFSPKFYNSGENQSQNRNLVPSFLLERSKSDIISEKSSEISQKISSQLNCLEIRLNEKLEEAKFKLNEDKLMDNSKNEEEEKIPKEFKNIDLEFSFFISWIKSLVLSLQITSRKPLDIKYITKEDIEEKNKRIKDIKNEIIKKRLFINKMTKKNEEIVKNTQPLSFLSDNLNHLEQCQKNLEILQSSYMNLAKIKNIFPECKILRENKNTAILKENHNEKYFFGTLIKLQEIINEGINLLKKKINAFDYNCKNGKYFYDSDFQESFSSETEEITDKEELLNEKILKRLVVEELNPMKQLESFVREDLKVKEFFKNNNIKPKHSGLFSLIDLEKSLK